MKRTHNKEDIVRAGLDLVLTRGFNGTGIEAILKQARVPKGSFYNYFSSKEEFVLAIIDQYVEDIGGMFYGIMEEESLPALERIQRFFLALIGQFEENGCSKGCLVGNLSLEMSDQFEKVRLRLEQAMQQWITALATWLRQAQGEGTVSAELDAELLAESVLSSFQGALLRAKVQKSVEPLRHFVQLYFERFLVSGPPGGKVQA
ncbi:MAG: TetR family transcriptional regulator C-terminal domain-containing protein [Desulfuromonadaceae bacterium]